MCHWLTSKIVTLDRALETFSFGLTDDVHELADFEVGDRKFSGFRSCRIVSEAEFTNEALGCGFRFGEVAGHGLANALWLLVIKTDLNRCVFVLFD